MAGAGNLLVPVGVLGFVYDMLEGLAGLVQVDLCFINSRLQHMQSLSLGQQYLQSCAIVERVRCHFSNCASRRHTNTTKIVARQHCQLDTKPCSSIHIAIVVQAADLPKPNDYFSHAA